MATRPGVNVAWLEPNGNPIIVFTGNPTSAQRCVCTKCGTPSTRFLEHGFVSFGLEFCGCGERLDWSSSVEVKLPVKP